MRTHAFALALLVVAVPGLAQDQGPVAGDYAFDWLKPTTTQCKPLTEALVKRFAPCRYEAQGTFGLADPAFVCRVSRRSEYFVYKSKAVCLRNLETMQANAP